MRQTLISPGSVDSRKPATASEADSTAPIRAVEQAVRAVLAELLNPATDAHDHGTVFPERLLLLRHAEALPRGTREIRIAPGTVVTPLARQALKHKEIALRFVSRNEVERAQRRGEWAFGVDAPSGITAAFRRALLESPEPWTELDALSATDWLGGSTERGALLLTEESSVAVWMACQVPGIRAAAAETCEAASRAVRNLGVNLLVVEPAGKSIALLRQLAQTLRAGGAPRARSAENFAAAAPAFAPRTAGRLTE
jgi:hypothetical protein